MEPHIINFQYPVSPQTSNRLPKPHQHETKKLLMGHRVPLSTCRLRDCFLISFFFCPLFLSAFAAAQDPGKSPFQSSKILQSVDKRQRFIIRPSGRSIGPIIGRRWRWLIILVGGHRRRFSSLHAQFSDVSRRGDSLHCPERSSESRNSHGGRLESQRRLPLPNKNPWIGSRYTAGN